MEEISNRFLCGWGKKEWKKVTKGGQGWVVERVWEGGIREKWREN